MLSCKIIPKLRFLANLHRKQAYPKHDLHKKQAKLNLTCTGSKLENKHTSTNSTHYIHTSGAQSRVRLQEQANCIRVVLALNLDIESQGEADER